MSLSGFISPAARRIAAETHQFTRFEAMPLPADQRRVITYCAKCGMELLPGVIAVTLPPCGEPLAPGFRRARL